MKKLKLCLAMNAKPTKIIMKDVNMDKNKREDAKKLFKVLRNTLPSETYDHLLKMMIKQEKKDERAWRE